MAAYPVTGPLDVIGDAPAGVLHEDLRSACIEALRIPRHNAVAHARRFSWERATEQFLQQLRRAADPETWDEAAPAR